MDTEKVKRYKLLEIALAAIFFLGLLVAQMIVRERNKPPRELLDGQALIEAFLKTRQELSAQPDEAFLIRDRNRRNRGYYYARHSLSEHDDQRHYKMQIQMVQYNVLGLASELSLDPLEKAFHWETKITDFHTKRTSVYEIAPDANKMLLVKRDGQESETLPADQFLLPEPLLVEFTQVFLQSRYSGVIVDIISPKGLPVRVYLKKLSPEEAVLKPEGIQTVVQIDFLRFSGFFEELYYDESGNLLWKYDQQRRLQWVWQAVPAESLQEILQEEVPASREGEEA